MNIGHPSLLVGEPTDYTRTTHYSVLSSTAWYKLSVEILKGQMKMTEFKMTALESILMY